MLPKKPLLKRYKSSNNQDYWTYRMAVVTLAITVIGCVAGAVVLQICGKSTPDLLTTLAPCAIAALAGIVTPSAPNP
ncbi:hypothetical protein [Nostoc sp. WHI]|uniref:hypothetical protein n=1 Tax=Nostoc sp. WHI TaxID=2650611 RepID=UPI0018C68EB8|nr:hypothetical protein [Nostoc sp. WHI]MBG1271478.1 hypothetical protein [Nostoc sp. WHI]